MDSSITIILIMLCLILESLYSGGEIAFVSADIHRIRNKAKEGSKSAKLALELLESPEWFLATTLTGTNLFIVTSTTLMTALSISAFGPYHGEMVALLVMVPTLLAMIISRNVFQRNAETLSIKLSRFIWISSYIFWPVVYLIAKVSKGTVRVATGESDRSYSYVTKDGLKYILEEQGADSDILRDEKDMVKNIIDFSEVTVGDIMLPLSAMMVLPETATLKEAVSLATEKKHLRIPVFRDQVYNITGIIHFFDLLETMHTHAHVVPENNSIASCVKPVAFYVPETKLAKELLIELQARTERMAVVVDEYGGAVGIVTMEDILEEIVGEIEDEYESGEKLYRKIGPGKYLFNARIHIEKVQQSIHVNIPEGNYETLGGFLLYKMGKIPRKKESLRFGDTLFVIEDSDAKAIKEVMIVLSPETDKTSV
jgi:putative hemolysin